MAASGVSLFRNVWRTRSDSDSTDSWHKNIIPCFLGFYCTYPYSLYSLFSPRIPILSNLAYGLSLWAQQVRRSHQYTIQKTPLGKIPVGVFCL